MDHFVVRLGVPAPSADDVETAVPGLHVLVSHVGSGRTETFRDGRELLRRLVELRRPESGGGSGASFDR